MFIIDTIKNIFFRIFNRNKNMKLFPINNEDNMNNVSYLENMEKLNFRSDICIRKEYNCDKKYELEKFMKELENNPNLVENLSDDRLDKLIKYYEKIIAEKEVKIRRISQY